MGIKWISVWGRIALGRDSIIFRMYSINQPLNFNPDLARYLYICIQAAGKNSITVHKISLEIEAYHLKFPTHCPTTKVQCSSSARLKKS